MVNSVALLGRTGKDPEVRQLETGLVANITLATSEKWTAKNGDKMESTEWHNLTVYGQLADVFQKWVKKGDLIYVQGKIKYRSWEKDGQTHYRTEIVVRDLQMLGGKKQDEPTNDFDKEMGFQ